MNAGDPCGPKSDLIKLMVDCLERLSLKDRRKLYASLDKATQDDVIDEMMRREHFAKVRPGSFIETRTNGAMLHLADGRLMTVKGRGLCIGSTWSLRYAMFLAPETESGYVFGYVYFDSVTELATDVGRPVQGP